MRVAALVLLLFIPSFVQARSIDSVETTTTRHDIFAIREALRYYFTEYGYYPPPDIVLILKILQGNDVQGFNWRKIVFWEARPDRTRYWFWLHKGNIGEHGELMDAWGRPVAFQVDPNSGAMEMWSRGKDGNWDRVTAIARDLYWTIK